MNLQIRNLLKGLGFGLILSIVITFFVASIGSASFGGSFGLEGFLWLLQTSAIPIIDIARANIIKAEKKNSLLIIPDIVKITTTEGKVYNISIMDREKLINWAMGSTS